MSKRWDDGFLTIALEWAQMSKDPSTQVGAVLVHGRDVLTMGFNGFPEGLIDSPERLNDRELKNRLVVHAEENTICKAAKRGISTNGATIYMAAVDRTTGQVWGGAPCVRCTVSLIQAGIKEVVVPVAKNIPLRWMDDIMFARTLLEEAGIGYRECVFI